MLIDNSIIKILVLTSNHYNLPYYETFTEMSSDEELEKIKLAMMKRMIATTPQRPTILNDGQINELNDMNFSKALAETNKPILIDFWAEWCAPCKMMAPIIHQMALEYTGRVYFAKIDVDKNPQTSSQYGVISIPYFMVFRNGQPAGKIVGAVGKARLAKLLQINLT